MTQNTVAELTEEEKSNKEKFLFWRLRALLAEHPWGIPSTDFQRAFEHMFNIEFEIGEYGYELLIQMATDRPDIFAIQEPDDLTALIFPDHPNDKVLHDARVGFAFEYDNEVLPECLNRNNIEDPERLTNFHWEKLNSWAWINRDDDFPDDVVLAGDHYEDFAIPIPDLKLPSLASIGVYKAHLVSVSSPSKTYVNLDNVYMNKISTLSEDVWAYFKSRDEDINIYRVPTEFLYPGYPCLMYKKKERIWERCRIVRRSHKNDGLLVNTVDYGGIVRVKRKNLYLMPRVFLEIPPQAICVSIAGIEPVAKDAKWPDEISKRLRGFSYDKYFLNVLLLSPEEHPLDESESSSSKEQPSPKVAINTDVANHQTQKSTPNGKFYRKYKNCPNFQAILCDRHDPCLDIFIDNILVIEGLAKYNSNKKGMLEKYRSELLEVLTGYQRPTNPMVGRFLNTTVDVDEPQAIKSC